MRTSILAVGSLILTGFLIAIPINVEAGQVNSVDIVTERIDNINGSMVNATVNVSYGGQITTLPSTQVFIEWFYPNGTEIFNETVDFTDPDGDKNAHAYSQWLSNYSGPSSLPFWINVTYVGDPTDNDTTQFYVFQFQDHVIVNQVDLRLARSIYELGEVVTADVNLTFFGNVSLLKNVAFSWYNSSGVIVHNENLPPDTMGNVQSSWLSDENGFNFWVNATYLGNDTITQTAYFDVVPKRVKTWHNTSISSNTFWDSGCPYGVNGTVTIQTGATLTISPGCVVKFNYSSGFLVNGALVTLGNAGNPVIFTSYQFSLAGGDWDGIDFQSSTGSIIQYSIVEFGTDAIIADSSSPLIENSVIRNSSRRGISLYDSQATIRNNTITNNSEGMYIYDSTPVVAYNLIDENLAGIRLDNSADATFTNNQIYNNSYGINVTQSTNVSIVSTTFWNNNLRALNVNTASDLSVWNSTFQSNTVDVLLIAAEVSLINSPFNESKLSMTPGSTLYVKNFLHIQTEDQNGTAFGNATVRVMVDGLRVFNGSTDSLGRINWIVLTDRTYVGTNAPVKSQIVVNVTAGENYTVANNDRTVDLASTHTETFVVSGKDPPNGPPPDDSSLDLVPLLTVLAFVLCASIILGTFLLFKRRKPKEEKEVKKKKKKKKKVPKEVKKVEKPTEFVAKPVVPVVKELKKGSIYLLDEEKPTGAYKIFKKELEGGAKGLIITKTPPKKVKEKYSIDCGFIWLTRETSDESVNPTNLGSILNSAKGFLKGVDNGILVMDGLEYLIVQNQFSKALMFIHLLNESVSTSNSRVLISFNLKSLDDVERALLTSDLEVLS